MIGPKGMKFNGYDLSPWLDANPTRPILPPVEVEADEVPGADGARFRSARLGELEIPVVVRLRASADDDIAELRHMLAPMLCAKSPAPLVLGDDPTRYHLAVLEGSSDLDRLWRTGRAELVFRACDPIAFGKTSAIAMATAATANVGGTWKTAPTITARPSSGSGYRITLVETGEYVQVNAPFTGEQTLVIDCGKQHCTVSGASADEAVTLASDYFELSPGLNQLSAENGTATVEWTERWL